MILNLKYIIIIAIVFFILLVPFLAFAQGLVPCDGALTTGESVGPGGGCDFTDFIQLIQNIINFLMFDVAAPLAAIVFAWAGITMFTAGGSPDKIKQANETFKWVLIGIIVALSGWLIVSAIMGTLLGTDVTNFLQDNFLDF